MEVIIDLDVEELDEDLNFVQYDCPVCDYKFWFKTGRRVKDCPDCGNQYFYHDGNLYRVDE